MLRLALCRLLAGLCCFIAAFCAAVASAAAADQAAFDLAGPMLRVQITRNGQTLSLDQVPSLAAGDRLAVKVELPKDQSAEYLMVAAFLRGPTNPPPKDWFYRCDTWTKKCVQNGLSLTVPADAQQLLIFFAPRTGGDYKTLVGAVQGRPGAFVRAAQELNQAALDRLRLEQYLKQVRALDATDPAELKQITPLLARSLAIKVDEKCLDRLPALQAPCLMQGQNSMILNDGHGASVMATLTSGPASDLALQAGATPVLSSNSYVPYIGSILDLARLFDSFHTAHYQYIPALPMHRGGDLVALMLNTPPSFHEPQSVLVAALPAVDSWPMPVLHAVERDKSYCAQRSPLVLPVDGEPIVFATQFAHNLALTVRQADGTSLELPAVADATVGGVIADTSKLPAPLDENLRAQLHGSWGFDSFVGPEFNFVNPTGQGWRVAPGDESALVVGREDVFRLQASDVSCVQDVSWSSQSTTQQRLSWKALKENQLELKLPLQGIEPGPITLLIHQYGSAKPIQLHVNTYADAGSLDSFSLHSGDEIGVLKGTRLDQVERLTYKGIDFLPGELTSANGVDAMPMKASDAQSAASLSSGDSGKATVRLKDGRTLKVDATIAVRRPKAQLLAKNMQRKDNAQDNQVQLNSKDELPPDARLTFSMRAQSSASFGRDTAVEVQTVDGAFSKVLNLANGGLTLENSRVAVATMVPVEALGASAFGDLQFRLISQGASGDWQPLATLVRLPSIADVQCPNTAESACQLKGSQLFLIEALAADRLFTAAVIVPDGYTGYTLTVPRPIDGTFFVKLRDDPDTVNRIVLTNPPPAPVPNAQPPAEPPTGKTDAAKDTTAEKGATAVASDHSSSMSAASR